MEILETNNFYKSKVVQVNKLRAELVIRILFMKKLCYDAQIWIRYSNV